MELFVGGRGQGKLGYVLGLHPELGMSDVFDAAEDDTSRAVGKKIINHFNMLIRRGTDETIINALIARDDVIIISDEVGLGVIPDNISDIRYRENVGRYLCRAASAASRFERIVCGIGQRLK